MALNFKSSVYESNTNFRHSGERKKTRGIYILPTTTSHKVTRIRNYPQSVKYNEQRFDQRLYPSMAFHKLNNIKLIMLLLSIFIMIILHSYNLL
jgi:hypothetical protein